MKRPAAAVLAAVAVSLVVAVGAVAAPTPTPTTVTVAQPEHPIVGTWLLDVTPTQPAGEPRSQALVTFMPGGGLVATESDSPTVGLGSWKALNPTRVAMTGQHFAFNPKGAPAGRAVVRAEATVRGDQLSGPYSVQRFDTHGRLVQSGRGTTRGRRFAVQPLTPPPAGLAW